MKRDSNTSLYIFPKSGKAVKVAKMRTYATFLALVVIIFSLYFLSGYISRNFGLTLLPIL